MRDATGARKARGLAQALIPLFPAPFPMTPHAHPRSDAGSRPWRTLPFALTGLLLLASLLAACGESGTPTAGTPSAGTPSTWPAPRWQEERSRSSGVGGAVVIKATGRTSLDLGLYDQGLKGMTPGLAQRVLLPGEAVRIDWRYEVARVLEPEEAPPAAASEEGRTEAWRLLLTFGYADLGEWSRSVLLWARPGQMQRTILAGVAPPTFETLPTGQPVWIGGAAAGDPGFGDGLRLRIRGSKLEARVPGEGGRPERVAPEDWIGILALRIETRPASE